MKKTITYEIASVYLAPLARKNIDTLILGCTHYPLLKAPIASVLGRKVKLVDSAEAVARHTGRILFRAGLSNNKKSPGKFSCYVSDEPENFKKAAGMFLGHKLERIEKVDNV